MYKVNVMLFKGATSGEKRILVKKLPVTTKGLKFPLAGSKVDVTVFPEGKLLVEKPAELKVRAHITRSRPDPTPEDPKHREFYPDWIFEDVSGEIHVPAGGSLELYMPNLTDPADQTSGTLLVVKHYKESQAE